MTPLVPAGPSLAEALAFYVDQLGFALTWHAGTMAGIRRGGVELNLIEHAEPAWVENSSLSIRVDGLDALHLEYRGVAARVGPLEMKPWGRREFHMIVPSGVCLQFHQGGGVTADGEIRVEGSQGFNPPIQGH